MRAPRLPSHLSAAALACLAVGACRPQDVIAVPRDAASDGLPSATRFCLRQTPAPAFCEDFDDPAAPRAWTPIALHGGTVVVTDGGASPPAALRVASDPTAAATYAGIDVALAPSRPARVRMRFDVLVEALPEKAPMLLTQLRVYPTAADPADPLAAQLFEIFFFTDSAFVRQRNVGMGMGVVDGPDLTWSAPGGSLLGRWIGVEQTIELGVLGAPAFETVRLDGVVVLPRTERRVSHVDGRLGLTLGVEYLPANTTAILRYDNIAVEID